MSYGLFCIPSPPLRQSSLLILNWWFTFIDFLRPDAEGHKESGSIKAEVHSKQLGVAEKQREISKTAKRRTTEYLWISSTLLSFVRAVVGLHLLV